MLLKIIGFIVLCIAAFLGFGLLSERYGNSGDDNAVAKAGLVGVAIVVVSLILGWSLFAILAAVVPWVLIVLDETRKRNGNGDGNDGGDDVTVA